MNMAGVAGSGQILESIPTEFDYFESKVIQAAIEKEYDRDFFPISALQHGAPIEFLVRGADNLYLDLNNSKLEIKAKITMANGTNVGANVDVGPTNLTLHSLFSKVEMELSGKPITDSNNLYPYRAFLETLLSYDEDIAKTRLVAENWIKDTVSHYDDFSVAGGGTNLGFKARATRFATSNVVTMIGRPHIDLFHQDKDLPPGCDMKLRLIPSTDAFAIEKDHGTAEAFQIKITSARLLVRTKELSPTIQLAHERMLQTHNIRLPFTKVAMKTLNIPVGVTSIEFDNLYTGQIPDRILVGLLGDDRMNGDYEHNPFGFAHFNLSHIVLKVNGEQYPRLPYQPNFARSDYIREYLGLLEALNLDIGPKTIDLSPSDWANACPIFMFRIAPSGLPSIPRTGTARLDLKFTGATGQAINVLLYAEYPAIVEIDRDRNVIVA